MSDHNPARNLFAEGQKDLGLPGPPLVKNPSHAPNIPPAPQVTSGGKNGMDVILKNLNTALFGKLYYTESKKNAVLRCAEDFDRLSASLALTSDILRISLQNSCRILSQIIHKHQITLLTETDNNETASIEIRPVVNEIVNSKMALDTKNLVLGLLFGQIFTFLDTVNKLMMDTTQNALNLKDNLANYNSMLNEVVTISLDDTNSDDNDNALIQKFASLSNEDKERVLGAL